MQGADCDIMTGVSDTVKLTERLWEASAALTSMGSNLSRKGSFSRWTQPCSPGREERASSGWEGQGAAKEDAQDRFANKWMVSIKQTAVLTEC